MRKYSDYTHLCRTIDTTTLLYNAVVIPWYYESRSTSMIWFDNVIDIIDSHILPVPTSGTPDTSGMDGVSDVSDVPPFSLGFIILISIFHAND